MHAGLALDLLITRQAGNIPPLTYVFSLADRQGASIEEMLLFLQPSGVSKGLQQYGWGYKISPLSSSNTGRFKKISFPLAKA